MELENVEGPEKGKKWYDHSPSVLCHWHNTPGPTGYSANTNVFSRDIELASPPLQSPLSVSVEASAKMDRQTKIWDCVRKSMAEVQIQMKMEYDKRRKPAPHYKKGDRVWVRRLDSLSALPEKNEPYWVGPFPVTWQSALDAYIVERGSGRMLDVHVDFLKRCSSPPANPVPLWCSLEVAKKRGELDKASDHDVVKIVGSFHQKRVSYFSKPNQKVTLRNGTPLSRWRHLFLAITRFWSSI